LQGLNTTNYTWNSNTTNRAFKIVEEMVRKGADPGEISQHVFETQPLRRIKLLALVLNSLEVSPDGKVASVALLREMYGKTGARKEDAEESKRCTLGHCR
jgi:phosphoesterase RecJ-like protein